MEFNPDIGDEVRVCYDGKLGRAVKGVVLEKNKSGDILLEFCEWAGSGQAIKNWFARHTKESFGGYLKTPDSLMSSLFGVPGDWYSVYQGKEKTKCNAGS